MIRAHRDLTKPVLGSGAGPVLIGRDGRMFYLGDEMVRQSAGLVLRDQKVSDVVDLLAQDEGRVDAPGRQDFIVAVPPNSSTIYQDDLPVWAQNRGRRTEYDLLLEDLAARGVKTVDLRPALSRGAHWREKPILMHDSHWTKRGALSAFDAIVEADGHPDWRLDPGGRSAPPARTRAATLSGCRARRRRHGEREDAEPASGGQRSPFRGPTPDHRRRHGKPGPTIMVIGRLVHRRLLSADARRSMRDA